MTKKKSSNPKQACVDCHFFACVIKNCFPSSSKYSVEVVDSDYRNWVKEKDYEIKTQNSHIVYNEIPPTMVGLKCYKKVWPEKGYIKLSIHEIPVIPECKPESVPKYIEKAFEEITEVDRSNCFFYEYKRGMGFGAAEGLEKRKREDEKMALLQSTQNKGRSTKTEDRQQEGRINKKLRGIKKHYIQKKDRDKILKELIIECKGESNTFIAKKAMEEIEKKHGTKPNGDPIYEEKTLAKEVSKLKSKKKKNKTA